MQDLVEGGAQRPGDASEQRRRAVGEEGVVAGEQLVASVAGQRHLHVATGEPREQERGEEAGVGEGLIELRRRGRDQIEAVLSRELLRDVLGPEALGGELRPGRLVEALLLEADGEGLQRLLVADGERGDGGGVHSSREEHADRYVRDQALGHGGVEQAQELRPGLARGDALAGGPGDVPVAAEAEAAVVEDGDVRRGELADAAQDGGGRGDVFAGEVLDERLGIELPRDRPVRQQRLELGGEHDA